MTMAQEMIDRGDVEAVGTDSPIWLGVPLKTPQGPIGVLVVQDYEDKDKYSEARCRVFDIGRGPDRSRYRTQTG